MILSIFCYMSFFGAHAQPWTVLQPHWCSFIGHSQFSTVFRIGLKGLIMNSN